MFCVMVLFSQRRARTDDDDDLYFVSEMIYTHKMVGIWMTLLPIKVYFLKPGEQEDMD